MSRYMVATAFRYVEYINQQEFDQLVAMMTDDHSL